MVIVVILLWPSSTLSHLSSSITWLSLTCTLLSSWRILIKRIKKKRLGLWRKIWRCFIPNGQSMYLIHHSKWDIFEWFSCIGFFFNCTSFRQRFILTLSFFLNCIFQKYVNPISDIAVECIFFGWEYVFQHVVLHVFSMLLLKWEYIVVCTLGRDTICISHHNTSFLYSCIRMNTL